MADEKFIDAIKLIFFSPVILLMIALTGWASLFLTRSPYQEILGFAYIPDTWRWVIGVATLLASFGFIGQVGTAVTSALKKKGAQRKDIRNIDTLSEEERNILDSSLTKRTRTLYLWKYAPAVGALLKKGLLEETPQQEETKTRAYVVPLHVYEFLQKDWVPRQNIAQTPNSSKLK